MLRRMAAVSLCLVVLMLSLVPVGFADTVKVPDFITDKKSIPNNAALLTTKDMGVGWNLGNAFDAYDCSWLTNKLDYESAWCGVKTTRKMIQFVANSGNSARFVEVVWRQIAERFNHFGDRLVFEALNQPRIVGTDVEWYWNPSDARCRDAMSCIKKLNQVFVDTVRSTGGNNAKRYLMVSGYAANPSSVCDSRFALPNDSAKNRIIVSVHDYSPVAFTMGSPATGTVFGDRNERGMQEIRKNADMLYNTFIAKGIPVVLGEFGAAIKNGNYQDRVNYVAYVTHTAQERGIACCIWDNAAFPDTVAEGDCIGILDRHKVQWRFPKIVEAMMTYSEGKIQKQLMTAPM